MLIVLHEHKMIFVRCRKTASTSLEIELSKYAGSQDIITPISPRDEIIRQSQGGKPPQNYLSEYIKYYNHMPAIEIKAGLSEGIWNTYFKFCIERNPWDKVVSMFFHRLGRRTNARTLTEFIATGEFLEAKNHHLYCHQSTIMVDQVGRYENLEDDLNSIFNRVGLIYEGLSVNAKSQFRKMKIPYQDYFNVDDQNIVAKEFSDEISLHKYSF